jgi:hypothetical protein
VLIAFVTVSPYAIEQFGTPENTSGVAGEVLEQVKLPRSEVNRFSA